MSSMMISMLSVSHLLAFENKAGHAARRMGVIQRILSKIRNSLFYNFNIWNVNDCLLHSILSNSTNVLRRGLQAEIIPAACLYRGVTMQEIRSQTQASSFQSATGCQLAL